MNQIQSDAQATQQIVYEFTRASMLEGWWLWALATAIIAALLYLCVRFYRRDVGELSQPVRWTLIGLRVTAVVALVFFFFDLQRRTQEVVTRPSEVVVLVDTSQSMSLPAGNQQSSQSRADRTAALLAETDVLEKFAGDHRVSVYAFDDDAEPRLLETRGGSVDAEVRSDEPRRRTDSSVAPVGRPLATFGGVCLAVAIVLTVLSLAMGALGRGARVGWIVFAAAATWVVGIVCLGGVYTVRSEYSLGAILGAERPEAGDEEAGPDGDESEQQQRQRVVDWREQIAAAGPQSRIGDALTAVLADHDPSTLAGIVLLSDGQNNGGTGVGSAVAAARRNQVALYPVGLGSSDAPVNVRVVDLDVPKRVYPEDKFPVAVVLQGSGPEPLEVEVQLLDALADTSNGSPDAPDASAAGAGETPPPELSGTVVDSQKVQVANDGTLATARFEMEPESVGQRRLTVRVVAPPEDQNERDDAQQARYEVVSRKLRVMAVAGGPTREYRFVRNLLHRDDSIELDVLLQSGQPGMSQEADRLLQSFPSTAEELFQYDAITLFDPDWTALSVEQLDLLDRWLSQQAGGMVIVAGPVYHPQWTRRRTDPRVSRIAGFFPVDLSTRGPLLGGGRQGGENPWPLELTPEARRAEFFTVAEDPQESMEVWQQFSGVYDYVGVKNAKPAAKVYAYYSDPTTKIGGSLPVYMASQFYGAGRVFFQGSGEMWRLRGESDAYFNRYYTNLVRWVSEGRLLRDSNRGVLLVEPSRAMVGDSIVVRAVLTDAQYEPLEVPEVNAALLGPGGQIEEFKLLPLEGEPRPGTYGARFTVREGGNYEVRLTLGDALNEQVLSQSVQVRMPRRELENPRRNDAELSEIAAVTQGKFIPVEEETAETAVADQLVSLIRPQPQTTILPGTPDREFNERRNAVLMWLIASVLTFEWVTRRLQRLA